MQFALNRRAFLQAAGAGISLAGMARLLPAAPIASSAPNADRLGWRLGSTAYTFNQLPFFEGVEKIASLGLRYVEGFSWQPLSKENKAPTNETMPAALRKEVKKRLQDRGVKLVSCYLSELTGKGDAARKKFEWGKEMGLEFFVAEPAPADLDAIEKLCEEFGISLAIHNHPKPRSTYWNPDKVVEVAKGRSKRIGACADTGHWVRSGLCPVESLKKLEGRLVGMHLKDVVAPGKVDAMEVPWGEGKGSIEAVLRELHRQKAAPLVAIEYERHGDTIPEIRRSIAFLDGVAKKLGG
jgi:sugar phosphate isomerase/epimerase